MAEQSEGQETGADASGAGVYPFAAAMALGSASRTKADRFLEEQTQLVMDQRHHLREQFKQLRPGLWEKRLGVILRIATAAVGLGVAADASLMVWQASHSNSLVIDAFAMPPDMVERGLTGEVVARQMLDRMRALNISGGFRSSISYANVWNNEVKVEIPETGVSAPNWGRLHLKWGEALGYAGKKDEAANEFAKATALDLTSAEKAELARSHAVATNP